MLNFYTLKYPVKISNQAGQDCTAYTKLDWSFLTTQFKFQNQSFDYQIDIVGNTDLEEIWWAFYELINKNDERRRPMRLAGIFHDMRCGKKLRFN